MTPFCYLVCLYVGIQTNDFAFMKVGKVLLIFALICLVYPLSAQEENFGTRINAGIESKVNNWTLTADGEIRTIYYVRLISRGSVQLSADYKIAKPVSVGAGYEIMNFLDVKFRPRGNMNGTVSPFRFGKKYSLPPKMTGTV